MFLSIVIVTLGGETLEHTIQSIMDSSIVPNEIIISIPIEEALNVMHLQSGTVRIHASNLRGQVAQRCEGFKVASGDFVIQMDDDILVEPSSIESLIRALQELPKKSACAPSLYFKDSDKSVYSMIRTNSFFQKLYYWILNGRAGYQEGVITKAGTEIGVSLSKSQERKIYETEWLPGGMAIHRNENLIIENYFPFSGKAYNEDLYHSLELRRNDCSLFICGTIKAWIDDPRLENKSPIKQTLRALKKDYLSRKLLVKRLDKSIIRLHLYYFIRLLTELKRSLFL